MRDSTLKKTDISLSGKYVSSRDGLLIDDKDFVNLTNMRYTDTNPKAVSGQTLITQSTLANKPRIMYHFKKDAPSESHLLVQETVESDNTITSSALYDITSPTIPNAGAPTETLIHTDTSGVERASLSSAPNGSVVYNNGLETVIWGGNSVPCGKFINSYVVGSVSYYIDYTDEVEGNDTNTAGLYKSSGSSTDCIMYIMSSYPINKIIFDVSTANTTASTLSVQYTGVSGWTSCTNTSDGTSAGGISLAQDGTVTFDSTVSTARQYMFQNILGYWYKVTVTNITESPRTTLSQVSVHYPPQSVKNVWSGEEEVLAQVYKETLSGGFTDYTSNVLKTDFNSSTSSGTNDTTTSTTIYSVAEQRGVWPIVTNGSQSNTSSGTTTVNQDYPSTYMDISSLASTGNIYIGSPKRLIGVYIHMPSEYVNSEPTTAFVSYWDKENWISMEVSDNTAINGTSLSTTGILSWIPPNEVDEHETTINGSPRLYFYKITFLNTLSAETYIDYMYGIPIYSDLKYYSASTLWRNRLILAGDISDETNVVKIGASNSNVIFNGADSCDLYIGDRQAITYCESIISKYNTGIQETLLVFKKNQTYAIEGNTPEDFVIHKISDRYGCIANHSFASCDLGATETGTFRNVGIWLSSTGLIMYDTGTITPIDQDISDIFTHMYDSSYSTRINPSMMKYSVGFYDVINKEYHFLYAEGTSTELNKELVYDISRRKWYKIERGTDNTLIFGINVHDSNGNYYTYGSTSNTNHYIHRLEYGNDFNGTDIVCTLRISDKPYSRSIADETNIRYVMLYCVSKSANSVTLTYYKNGVTTGTVIDSKSIVTASARLSEIIWQLNKTGNVHSFELSLTSDDEYCAFEPLTLTIMHKDAREEIRT